MVRFCDLFLVGENLRGARNLTNTSGSTSSFPINKPGDPLSSEKCQLVTLSPAWPVIHNFRAQQVPMGTHITQQADSRTDGRNPEKKTPKMYKTL